MCIIDSGVCVYIYGGYIDGGGCIEGGVWCKELWGGVVPLFTGSYIHPNGQGHWSPLIS